VRKAPSQVSDAATQEQEIFYPIGTLARITHLSQPRPGLMLIQCTGLQRFAVSQRNLLKHGLWVADVSLLPDDQSVPVPDDLKPIADTLKRVVTTLQAQGTPDDQMPMQPPYLYDDCAWVANRWCDVLPIPLELKHQLMALDNPLVRLELVSDMLERNGIST
jgi:Lon protease-like protein